MNETVRLQVARILRDEPQSRNSDKYLLWRIMQNAGIPISLAAFEELPSMESITRVRRDLQAHGHYLPDEDTQEMREEAEQAYREEYAT